MRRRWSLTAAFAVLALLVAVPALAAGGKSNAPGQQKDKQPSTPITISGVVVESSVPADGESGYTLTDGGTTYILEAGPRWFFEGGAYPLDKYVGKDVTVQGELHAGNHVDVLSIDGTTLREPGKPPWAGGWKAVGEKHPGWSQDKADRFKAKFGECFPPGQCKDKPAKDETDSTDDDAD